MSIPASREYITKAMQRIQTLEKDMHISDLTDFMKYKGQIFSYDNATTYIRIHVGPGPNTRNARKNKKDCEVNTWEYSISYISKLKGQLFQARIRPWEGITFTVKTSYKIPGYVPNSAMGGKDRTGAIEQYKTIPFIATQAFIWMNLLNAEMGFLATGKYPKHQRLEEII